MPKKEPNKFRLIHHLSFPKGRSVNDAIDPEECTVLYTSFDAAVGWVRQYGKGALMEKVDIESVFVCSLFTWAVSDFWGAVGKTAST